MPFFLLLSGAGAGVSGAGVSGAGVSGEDAGDGPDAGAGAGAGAGVDPGAGAGALMVTLSEALQSLVNDEPSKLLLI